jgi:hypothetical protein
MVNSTPLAIIKLLVIIIPVTFVVAALLHAGVPLPLGITEPRIVPAMIVETLIASAFAVAAIGVFSGARWAWTACVAAHAVGIAGVLLGIVALAMGRGPTTDANYVYHRVVLTIMIGSLILLLTPAGRTSVGRSDTLSGRAAAPK